MMKKICVKFVMLSVLAVFVGVGCMSAAVGQAAEKYNLSICGGSIGGAWAAIGEGVGEVIRRSFPGSNTAYEVGQEAANLALVSRGKIELGIAHAQLLKMGMEGVPPFKEKYDNLRALCVLYKEAVEHFIVRRDSGVESFEQLKEKQFPLKVNFNTKDSFMEIVGREVLAAYGITYDDLKKWGGNADFMSMGASLDLMRDGKIQAYSNVIQVPSSHVVDISTNVGLNLFGMSEGAQKTGNDKLGTYSTVIPKDKYNFLTADVPTVGATVVLFTNADLSDDAAYAVVKAIDENFEYFKSIHSSLKDLTLESLHDVAPAPLHPGAEKYFAEKSAK